MYLCLRIDLDYVPWDTPDAGEFGHGEPAALIRLLELARYSGAKYHFFASERVLRAFPSHAEAALNDGHELDWLCKHPEQGAERYAEVMRRLGELGHRPVGFALRGAWPAEVEGFAGIEDLRFLSAVPGSCPLPPHLTFFPVQSKPLREAIRGGSSMRAWSDGVKLQIREAASRRKGLTVCVRPQVLAKHDARLNHLREVLELARAVELPVRTLREVLG